ncbi:MAG: hypothetical protein GX282_04835 [Campylobacteraceae bacterium]|nr:hypothetical protein [Campylobacteraceae bacterium]
MKKLYLALIFLALLTGCSTKESKHEPFQNELLAYTQKFERVNRSDRYLAVATYINPVLKTEDLRERFVLSSYPVEEEIVLGSIKVNGGANLSVRELSHDDELLELANIKLPWSKHYEIISPEKKADYLTLTYETSRKTKVNLRFLKVSKSMYWNPKVELDD